jgi:ubiquinone/menaquinone biosynthesis C-methylase UbiE
MMDARLQIRVQRYGWDAAASHYHIGWERQLKPAQDTLLRMADVKAGQSVIETACGSGMVTLRLANAVGAEGLVTATDLSQGMIDDLTNRMDASQVMNVTTQRGPLEKLDQPDSIFDAAICALGLMYTPDPTKAVAEMARVVAPGGTVAALVWGERRNCGWADVFPIVDARVASEVCPMFFGTGAPNALFRTFEQAGLQDIIEHRQSEFLQFEDETAVLDAVLLGGPVALAVKRFDKAAWQEVCQEFLSSVLAYRQADGSYSISGEFVAVSGVVPIL